MGDIDFNEIAEAALARAEQLLAEWLPSGKREGCEWKSINPTRADQKAGSFSINIDTGAWGDFACGDSGGDLISVRAYLFHGRDNVAAARYLADLFGIYVPPPRSRRGGDPEGGQGGAPAAKPASPPVADATPKPERKKRSPWTPVLPVPAGVDAPPLAHSVRGMPQAVWCYKDAEGQALGYIYRFVTSDGGKEVVPLTLCRHDVSGKLDWRWMSFPEPRPLYGLDRLAAKPEATVLMLEGEKCADVGHAELADLVSMSWAGGCKAVSKADFSSLAGRKVILWPDGDAQREKLTKAEETAGVDPLSKPLLPIDKQPGYKAMAEIAAILLELGCKVWMVDIPAPGECPPGWDIADAVEGGLAGAELAAWVRDHARLFDPSPPPSETLPDAAKAGAGEEDDSDDWEWERRLLRRNHELVPCLANVFDCLNHFPEWQGVVAFDEFAQSTVKLKPPPYPGGEAGSWTDADDSQTAIWLTRKMAFAPSSSTVSEAVETLGKLHSFHPVRDWLRSLPAWDGVPRTDTWISEYLGVEKTDYTRRVSAFFLRGMVARVMKPGVKFDTCLVLEGPQGKGKSTAVSILGGQWYGDTDLDLQNKDSMAALAGHWVYEFAEMGSVTRSESSRQKSFLSRQKDEYRPVYGRRMVSVPRQVVFVGTINEWEWIKDPTGGRRFWPVDCQGNFDLEGLRAVRDQLFAEALHSYEAGKRFWPTPEEQKEFFDPEQLKRELQESYVDAIHDWVFAQVSPFSLASVVMDGLKLDASKLTRDLTTRIGNALHKLGCTKFEKRNGMIRYWYNPPAKKDLPEKRANSQAGQGGECGYF